MRNNWTNGNEIKINGQLEAGNYMYIHNTQSSFDKRLPVLIIKKYNILSIIAYVMIS